MIEKLSQLPGNSNGTVLVDPYTRLSLASEYFLDYVGRQFRHDFRELHWLEKEKFSLCDLHGQIPGNLRLSPHSYVYVLATRAASAKYSRAKAALYSSSAEKSL